MADRTDTDARRARMWKGVAYKLAVASIIEAMCLALLAINNLVHPS